MSHLPLILALSNRTFAEQEIQAGIARLERRPREGWRRRPWTAVRRAVTGFTPKS
ncbi:hypothetical protein [Sphingomonas arenae]|uniref:hypothetical protein n=1 Tax=Sphingomonas arenae TaxID=2812555 RepID=UPI0019688BDE|nr:hypothetical protein [Sphingomonas arenae]